MQEIVMETIRLMAFAFISVGWFVSILILVVLYVAGLLGGAFLPLKYHDQWRLSQIKTRNCYWWENLIAFVWVIFYFVFYFSLTGAILNMRIVK